MKARGTFIGILLALCFALLFPAGSASGEEGTPCSAVFDISVSPGLSEDPSSGTFTSGGETGSMECRGEVNGKQAIGPGTWGVEGAYGTADPDDCTSGGEGEAEQSFTVPTTKGNEHITNMATFTYGALEASGLVSGEFESPRFSGTFEVIPTEGDCVTEPITRAHVELRGMLKNEE